MIHFWLHYEWFKPYQIELTCFGRITGDCLSCFGLQKFNTMVLVELLVLLLLLFITRHEQVARCMTFPAVTSAEAALPATWAFARVALQIRRRPNQWPPTRRHTEHVLRRESQTLPAVAKLSRTKLNRTHFR